MAKKAESTEKPVEKLSIEDATENLLAAIAQHLVNTPEVSTSKAAQDYLDAITPDPVPEPKK